MALALILVEPAGPLNLGSTARVMKNFGLSDLRLVAPVCSPSDPQAALMAVHAQEVLQGARIFATLPEALADRDRVVGTTARTRDLPAATGTDTVIPWVMASQAGALVFGPEDRGLSNPELDYCHQWLTLPTHPNYSSLNLAQAVGICCYLVGQVPAPVPSPLPLARTAELEGYYTHLSQLLLDVGYLEPHTQHRRMAKIRRIFSRAGLTSEEVALLRGMVRQLDWATRRAPES